MNKIKKKKCKNCNKLFIPYNSLQKGCSITCAREIVKTQNIKKQEDYEKNKQILKELGIEDVKKKKLSKEIKNVVVQVHFYIRERDKYKPCISCGASWNNTFEAGHFFPAGKYKHLKFNLNNIFGQCTHCNRRLEGNVAGSSISIPERIGKPAFDELFKLAMETKNKPKRFTFEELNEIKIEVKKRKALL